MSLFILRNEIGVGVELRTLGWGVVQKMAIYLILCSENVLT